MTAAVTFDFHNTLATCDEWFDLEVRHLASAFMRWQGAAEGTDVDPTLLVEADAAYRRLRESIMRDGRELTAEMCVARILSELDRPVDEATIAQGVETLMRGTFAGVAPVPGAIDTVRELAASGVPLGIVSNAVYHPFLEWTLDQFGLRDAFAEVTTSASGGFYKSRPELFWHTIAGLGATPERSVHVGDSFRFDVGGAKRAGMKTVWLSGGAEEPPAGSPPPDLTLSSLSGASPAIIDLLRSEPGSA